MSDSVKIDVNWDSPLVESAMAPMQLGLFVETVEVTTELVLEKGAYVAMLALIHDGHVDEIMRLTSKGEVAEYLKSPSAKARLAAIRRLGQLANAPLAMTLDAGADYVSDGHAGLDTP